MTEPPSQALVVPSSMRGERLDRVLDALVPEASRSLLQKWVRKGRVRLDGRRVHRSNIRVHGGESVAFENRTPAQLVVLFEDEHIAVVDKPAGLVVHPTERIREVTLSDLLVNRYGELPSAPGDPRPGIVHRLDRDTSGVLVAARTPRAFAALKQAFRDRTVKKTYLALVHGQPARASWTVDKSLGPLPDHPDRQCIEPAVGAKVARTDFECVESLGDASVVEAHPTSGRRHQIRVHLAHSGVPILGDVLYGPHDVPQPLALSRQALHAHRLAFAHPASGEQVSFESPLAPDLAEALGKLRQRAPKL